MVNKKPRRPTNLRSKDNKKAIALFLSSKQMRIKKRMQIANIGMHSTGANWHGWAWRGAFSIRSLHSELFEQQQQQSRIGRKLLFFLCFTFFCVCGPINGIANNRRSFQTKHNQNEVRSKKIKQPMKMKTRKNRIIGSGCSHGSCLAAEFKRSRQFLGLYPLGLQNLRLCVWTAHRKSAQMQTSKSNTKMRWSEQEMQIKTTQCEKTNHYGVILKWNKTQVIHHESVSFALDHLQLGDDRPCNVLI